MTTQATRAEKLLGMNEWQLQTTSAAIHEAGHAAARWLLGLSATAVYIRDDGSGGCGGDSCDLTAREYLCFLMGGYAAESMFSRIKPRFNDIDDGLYPGSDLTLARAFLRGDVRRCMGKPIDVAIDSYFNATMRLLLPGRGAIEAMAVLLMREKSLSAHQIASHFGMYSKRRARRFALQAVAV